jgi:hypothetical protein
MTRDITGTELKEIRDQVNAADAYVRKVREQNPTLRDLLQPVAASCLKAWHLLTAQMRARGYKGRRRR